MRLSARILHRYACRTLEFAHKFPDPLEKSPQREEARRLGYYRNAVLQVARRRIGASLPGGSGAWKMEKCHARIFGGGDNNRVRKYARRARAGRNQCDTLPRVRRQSALLLAALSKKFSGLFRRAGNSCNNGAPGSKFPNVWRESDFDHEGGRGRWSAHALGHEWRSFLSIGDEHSFPLSAPRPSMVAVVTAMFCTAD